MHRPDIYIIYSHRDSGEIAYALCKELNKRGLSVFLDKNDLLAGADLRTSIERQITDARYVVVLISKASHESKWMTHETGLALRKKDDAVIPVLLGTSIDETPIASLLGSDRLYIDIDNAEIRNAGQIAYEIAKRVGPVSLKQSVIDAMQNPTLQLGSIMLAVVMLTVFMLSAVLENFRLSARSPNPLEASINAIQNAGGAPSRNLQNEDLRNANFSWLDFAKTDFQGAKLSNCVLRDANISDADFRNADLRRSLFLRAEGTGTDFRESNLQEADFTKAIISNSNFQGTDLMDSILSETTLIGANFRAANLSRVANLETANLTNATYNERTTFPLGFDPDQHGMKLASTSDEMP